MKRGFLLLFCCSVVSLTSAQVKIDHKLAFQDSVRVIMETGQNTETSMVGGTFATAWHKLSLTQQEQIMIQAEILRKRRYKPFPLLADYYGAIAFAIEREGADSDKLDAYLRVAGKVIEKEKPAGIVSFFHYMRDYFEYHAFHYERSYRLHAEPEHYTFEYIEEAPPLPQTDTVEQTDAFQQWDNPDPQQDANTAWENDTLKTDAMPSWMMSTPQPVLSGPVMKLEGTTFTFSTPYDSASLRNTRGTLSLRDGTFVGEKGTFGWDPAGLSGDSVYFEFKEYNFNVDKPHVKAENGKLRYAGRASRKIDGIFEFKSVRHKSKETSQYPRFMSFQANVTMEGFSNEDLRYVGGFALNGKQLFSSSVSGDYARLEVYHKGERKFVARSRQFEFKDSIITAKRAMINLYQDSDSIYHPAVKLRYDYGKKQLSLDREMGPLRDTPYSSSFFNVDFSSDQLRWDVKSDSLNLVTIGGNNQAAMIIESKDYYHPDDYRLLSGKGFRFHPLAVVVNYANKNGVREFYLDQVAQLANISYEEGRMAMTFLSQKGMINYNTQTGWIQLKDKAIHFVDAKKGVADYDNLKIHSISENTANASINFPRRRMVVRGVEEVNVSDSLNVLLKPDSSVVTILENRDLKFDGKITAGNFEINGKDFTFKYDSFFVSLNKIDSIRFYVTERNAKGQTVRRRVNNAMVGADSTALAEGGMQSGAGHTSGTLFINLPDNKSGRSKVPHYPRLDATAGGVIYFDRSEILDGAYDRSVFFVIPPFRLDSLNDADPGSIHFDGTFVSSGMFPNFKEKLHTMPDKSLGFSHQITPQGYSLFKSDGRVFGNINLDNSGIRVGGRVDYLAATVESPDFIFYPDSVVARGKKGELKEKQFGNVWYPQATLADYELVWKPRQDRFRLKNQKGPFNLYNSTAQLDGTLTISKAGTAGNGTLLTRGSAVKSEELAFSAKEFSARHAEFQVKTTNPEKPALQGSDIRLKFNLEKNFADISPEIEGVAAIDFPYAQFKTSIPTARWDLTTQKITMTKDANVPLENSYFYTTREDLDSLAFNAEKAEYDIKLQQMKVSGIPFITVADARITPENNEVLILENARIGQLKNTTIVLDTLNGYHRMINGVVDIVSRKEFTGYATYQYINAESDTFAIKMENFRLEAVREEVGVKRSKSATTRMQTVASGTVPEQMNMILAPRMFYKGDMVMYATKPALQLQGYAKLDLRKIKNYNTWLKYSQSGDEKDIFIDFDHAEMEDGGKPDAGLHIGSDNSLYITFLNDKKAPDDDDFFLPSGALFFDKNSGEFRIEDRMKAAGEKLSGKVFSYNEDKQEVRFEGPVTFFRDSKEFSVVASAIGSGNLETNDIRANAFIMTNMNVPAQIFQMMAQDLQNVIKNEDIPEGLGDPTELLYKIADIVGERAAKDFEQRSLQGPVSLSTLPALTLPMVFSNVNLKWSQKHKAFYSEGPIGLSHLLKNDVNGGFEGFMEIRRNEDGTPVFHVFLKASPESWYYFGYEDNRLMIQSSRQMVNDVVSKRTNAAKAKLGELIFIPGSEDETLEFINRFRKNYYGKEDGYDLDATAARKKQKKKDEKSDDGF
ncbi:MAG: hypothetical protein JNN04_02035 [Cyclobacteriaceae bacterium]|nr:hypothetical protein [Cyclobacteriaceae bacterium]